MKPVRIVVAVALLAACATVGMTGRKQLILVSDEQEKEMGVTSFAEVKSTQKISADVVQNAQVKRVGERIASAAQRATFNWEFVVIDDPKTVNAFCLPGGKVAVYSGLLPVAKDDAGLATVLAHEVAHALARHGAERVSESMVSRMGLQAVMAGLGKRDPLVLQGVATAYGVGAHLGRTLPHGRDQESEADRMGLHLMAKAGYDPRQSIAFWKRMAVPGGDGTPEFLSTHPSHQTRIQQLQGWMPAEEKIYQGSSKAPR